MHKFNAYSAFSNVDNNMEGGGFPRLMVYNNAIFKRKSKGEKVDS